MQVCAHVRVHVCVRVFVCVRVRMRHERHTLSMLSSGSVLPHFLACMLYLDWGLQCMLSDSRV